MEGNYHVRFHLQGVSQGALGEVLDLDFPFFAYINCLFSAIVFVEGLLGPKQTRKKFIIKSEQEKKRNFFYRQWLQLSLTMGVHGPSTELQYGKPIHGS